VSFASTNSKKFWKWLYLTIKELHPTRGLRATPSRDGGSVMFRAPGSEAEPFAWLELEEEALRLRLGGPKTPGELMDGFGTREVRSKEAVAWLRVRLERGLPPALEVSHARDARAYVETWRVLGELAAHLGAWPRPAFVDHGGFVDDPTSRRHGWWGRVAALDPRTGCYGLPGLIFTDRGLIYGRSRRTLDVLLTTDGLSSEALIEAILRFRDEPMPGAPLARAGGGVGPSLGRFTWFSTTEACATWQGGASYVHELEHGVVLPGPDLEWVTWRYDRFVDRLRSSEPPPGLDSFVNTWGYAGTCHGPVDVHVTPLTTADGRRLKVTPESGVTLLPGPGREPTKIWGDAGGHPHTGAVHPSRPLVAVFSRQVSVIDLDAGEQVFSCAAVEAGCDHHHWSRSGTFHPAGRFLLWVSTGGVACCDLDTWSVREVLLNDAARGAAYSGPLHCSPKGDFLLLNTPGGPASFRWADLERAFATAPEVLPYGL
jgi:hypothetical protein